MKVIDIIGHLGSIVLSISFIPQTYAVYKNPQCANIYFTFLTFFCSVCLGVYSFYYNVIPMLVANMSVFVNNAFVLIFIFNIRKNNQDKNIISN